MKDLEPPEKPLPVRDLTTGQLRPGGGSLNPHGMRGKDPARQAYRRFARMYLRRRDGGKQGRRVAAKILDQLLEPVVARVGGEQGSHYLVNASTMLKTLEHLTTWAYGAPPKAPEELSAAREGLKGATILTVDLSQFPSPCRCGGQKTGAEPTKPTVEVTGLADRPKIDGQPS